MFDFWTGSDSLPIYGFVIRAFVVYLYIFLIVRVLGQRTMSSIDALDFIFGVVIGDILGEPLTDGELPLAGPVSAAALVAILHLGLAFFSLKSTRLRRVVEAAPVVLMRDGQLLPKQLKRMKITLDSFVMDLRLNNIGDLNEVDYAILEMNGRISVIKKTEYESLTLEDMNLSKARKGYPTVVIEDGVVLEENLKTVGNEQWLADQLTKRGYKSPGDIFFMTIDESGSMFVSPR
ncbi:DUF421 domain-containing protein [Shouchella shacheensis]|uniref:DUF421 domain-containing protein n=1 Tax=Shouchella shacheensis TaxID=1649580 RepID=UPI00073FB2ED|nr:DUF421 domain-containing protein [Shouchella shacheensis]